MEELAFSEFLEQGIADPAFLNTYLRDPQRLKSRYTLEDGLIGKLRSHQALLEAVAATNPLSLSDIARSLPGPNINAAFNDFRDSNDYSDKFNDQGPEFTDRYDDRHPT
jgi:hypothetical protein